MQKSSTRKPKKRRPEIYGINLGSDLEIYELQRHAMLSGARTVSGLIRILNNRLKSQYRDHLTLLEQSIIAQTHLGNNELLGLFEELRVEFAGLKQDTVKYALISLTNRGKLVEGHRGGKTEGARGAAVKCYFPPGHKFASDFTITTPQPNKDED